MVSCKSLKRKSDTALNKFNKIENIIENTDSKTKRLSLQKKADKVYFNYLKFNVKAYRCENKIKGPMIKTYTDLV